MTKGSDAQQPAERPGPPRTVNLATIAIGVMIGLSLLRAALLWGYTGTLKQSVIDANDALKNPKVLCGSARPKGCVDVAHQVNLSLIELTIGSILISLAALMCARKIKQGIRAARTVFVVLSIIGSFVGFAGSPLTLLTLGSGGPIVLRTVTGLAGLSALVAIVLLFLKESSNFFPTPQRGQGSGRGLGALFAPRPGTQRKPAPTSGLRSNAASRGQAKVREAATGAGARSKTRQQEAAIAHGAELARTRAKASKSRRTEL